MAPWLAITSVTPRPVLSAALGSSLRGQTETITSSVPVSVDGQQKTLSSGVGAVQALDGSGRSVLGSAPEPGETAHCPPSTAHHLPWPGHFGPASGGLARATGASTA